MLTLTILGYSWRYFTNFSLSTWWEISICFLYFSWSHRAWNMQFPLPSLLIISKPLLEAFFFKSFDRQALSLSLPASWCIFCNSSNALLAAINSNNDLFHRAISLINKINAIVMYYRARYSFLLILTHNVLCSMKMLSHLRRAFRYSRRKGCIEDYTWKWLDFQAFLYNVINHNPSVLTMLSDNKEPNPHLWTLGGDILSAVAYPICL